MYNYSKKMIAKKLVTCFMFCFITLYNFAQENAILIEAEKANVIGSDFEMVTDGDVTYLAPKTDIASSTNPGTADKILTFQVTFAAPGTYDLYVKLRVGPGGGSDDSFYFGSTFGTRQATVNADWITVNNIGNGSADPGAYVLSPGKNAIGNGIFKWINASETGATGGTSFVVEGSLTKTFQVGSRENGLDIDKIAFGNATMFYTVSNLESGEPGVHEIPVSQYTLSVDLSNIIRPVTHCANGSLYGLTETLPANIDALVAPLNPHVFGQPPKGNPGNQHPFGSAIAVSERLASTQAQVLILLPDLLPGWPYQWPGQQSWLAQVTSVINDKKASGRNNYYGYSIWNERHGTWLETNGDFYTLCWKPTYDLIRSLDPGAKIIGPADSYYGRTRISEFLTFCKNNNCVPDIMCWHELLGAANISKNIDDYRSLESSLGISRLPICINEYSHATHEYEGCPGISAPFIAKFERKQVQSASISWWFTNLPGRLGSLLTASNEKGGGWWFYKWYGDMTGNMVRVIPPLENSDGVDGFACLDLDEQYASVCLGGNYTGKMDVVINGIPAAFGASVTVKVESVSWSNKDTPVPGTTTVSNTLYPVANGKITVPVDIINPLYGYRVYVAPPFVTSAQNEKDNNVSVHPNPANDFITCTLPGSNTKPTEVSIYDLNGRLVKLARIDKDNNTVYLSELKPGIYILKLKHSNKIIVRKIIKR